MVGGRASFDEGGGLGGAATGVDQRLGEIAAVLDAHEDDESIDVSEFLPIVGRAAFAASRYDGDARGNAAVGDRDARAGRGGEGGTDTGDDFDGNTALAEVEHLLASSTKEEGVAGFKPDYMLSGGGVGEEEVENLLLNGILMTFFFAGVDELGLRIGEGEDFSRNEAIVKDNVCALE